MVADVTETRSVISSLGFKTCMTNTSLKYTLYFSDFYCKRDVSE